MNAERDAPERQGEAMLAILVVIGVAGMLGFVLVGGPVLVDGVRTRRDQSVQRQIALTDALDGRLGPIVAPLVRKPLWGPWEIRIAVPEQRWPAVPGILAVVHQMFSAAKAPGSEPYRIVLRTDGSSRAGRGMTQWARKRVAAA